MLSNRVAVNEFICVADKIYPLHTAATFYVYGCGTQKMLGQLPRLGGTVGHNFMKVLHQKDKSFLLSHLFVVLEIRGDKVGRVCVIYVYTKMLEKLHIHRYVEKGSLSPSGEFLPCT